jgi:hypothetical protein
MIGTASALRTWIPQWQTLGVQVLHTPVRASPANSLGERLGGNLRRACLD